MFNATPFGTVSVVWSFGHGLSGNNALSGVTLGTDGNFYGTTETNGEGPGTAYQLTPAGVYTVLRFFGNTGDGACPWAPPIEGTDGNYYGTTSTVCGFGALSTVYRLTSHRHADHALYVYRRQQHDGPAGAGHRWEFLRRDGKRGRQQ